MNTNGNGNAKNRYDWSRFCKIEKKHQDPADENAKRRNTPKLGEYNLKDPTLRTKGIKNRESRENRDKKSLDNIEIGDNLNAKNKDKTYL
jgi:hypothetical protein